MSTATVTVETNHESEHKNEKIERKKKIEYFVNYIDDNNLIARKSNRIDSIVDFSVFKRCFFLDLFFIDIKNYVRFNDATLGIVNYKPISAVFLNDDGFPSFCSLKKITKLPTHIIRQSGTILKYSKTFNEKDAGYNKNNALSMFTVFYAERQGNLFPLKDLSVDRRNTLLKAISLKNGDNSDEYPIVFNTLSLLANLALTVRYFAEMEIEISNGTSVSIQLDLAQLREVLNDREKRENGSRRAALLHLVSSHSRKLSSEDIIKIKEHLRGKIECKWRGFDIKLHPSQYDSDRLQKVS
jgi:hypothetical protein